MYFLVNASPELLDVATSNFVPEYYRSHDEEVLGNILCEFDPKVNALTQRAKVK